MNGVISGRPRILLYSHDTVGLGHLRRNQAIACGLARTYEHPSILIASGARQCTMFDTPNCVDVVTIPALMKTSIGTYAARSSGLLLSDAIALRSNILQTVVQSFRPDLLVVDKVPRGVHGELEPVLKWCTDHGAKCVLGLRDILDDTQTVRREWDRDANQRAIQQYYDAVWVYGDRRICNVEEEYRFAPTAAAKVRYAGYLDRSSLEEPNHLTWMASAEALGLPPLKYVLFMVGGGEDGAQLATAFTQAELPPNMAGVILTGPFMPTEVRERLHASAGRNPRLRVADFLRHPECLLANAERVVAMGGYNTVCEILSRRKTALIVPRVRPRAEQLIRAERMSELGLLEMLHPDELNPATLAAWLHKRIVPPTDARQRIDLNGLARVPHFVMELLSRGTVDSSTHLAAPRSTFTAIAGDSLP